MITKPRGEHAAVRAEVTPLALENCATCRFFIPDFDTTNGTGACHRHAPSPTSMSAGWPSTRATDWCGEYEAGAAPGTTAPTLAALVPDTVALGAPSFTLQVTGTGFTAQSVIVFAGHDEPTTVVSDTELTTGVDMTVWLAPDVVPVTVRNADGQVTDPVSFTFTETAGTREAGKGRR
jgi:hypothetical protein